MDNLLIYSFKNPGSARVHDGIVRENPEIGRFDHRSLWPTPASNDVVAGILAENTGKIANFAIVTDTPEVFSEKFPNNVIRFSSEYGDFAKLARQVMYIMTNFGRDYRNCRVFVTSDTHFWHANIIKYCNRPWSTVEEMNDALVENWNSVVGKNDKVIHLGDFCFGNKAKVEGVFRRLNGKIDLVMGNHDRLRIRDYYEMGFHRVYDHPVVYDSFFIMSHAPLQWVGNNMPFANVYGHVHDSQVYRTWTTNSCCACVERHGYKPIPFDDLKEKLREVDETT